MKALQQDRRAPAVWKEGQVLAAIEKLSGGKTNHSSRFALTADEEIGVCKWIVAENFVLNPQNRNDLRKHIVSVLLYRQRQLKKGRCKTPLNRSALKIISCSDKSLPTGQTIAAFYKRHHDLIKETTLEEKDVGRTAVMQAAPLRADFKKLVTGLVAGGLLKADGSQKWVHTAGEFGDDNGTRTSGWLARSKLFQLDEKGQWICYDRTTCRLSKVKYGVSSHGGRAIKSLIESRELFTYVRALIVPYFDTGLHVPHLSPALSLHTLPACTHC